MTFTLSEEDRSILNELYQEFIEIKQEIIEECLKSLIISFHHTIAFAKSFEDFSPANVRRYGLITILTRRALRFFGLELEEKSTEKVSRRHKRQRSQASSFLTRKNGYRFCRNGLKVVVFPLYLLLLLLVYLRKPEKNVKNKYCP